MFLFSIERVYLNEIAKRINRKDLRTARKWCKKNHVALYSDSGTEYVIKNDFDLAFNLPLILNLKVLYGDKWEQVYQAYNNDELHNILEMNQNIQNNNQRYIPQGKIAKKINQAVKNN
ncbi:MAG: hypothetical protein H0X63_12260 [Flavobacteriales bacterium]|nr:hypothetical protein [Flavobacteriales bacterium]